MGVPGPDASNGGKHLLVPPGWDGEVAEGYHIYGPEAPAFGGSWQLPDFEEPA